MFNTPNFFFACGAGVTDGKFEVRGLTPLSPSPDRPTDSVGILGRGDWVGRLTGSSFTSSSYTEELQESRQESARLVEDNKMGAIDTPAQKKAGVPRKSSRMGGLKTGANGAA